MKGQTPFSSFHKQIGKGETEVDKAKQDILQVSAAIIMIAATIAMLPYLFHKVREINFPNPAKVPLREFLFVAEKMSLTFRIDEKLYVDFDEYLVVFSGMARDSSGRMLPLETPVEGSIVGSRQGLIARGTAGGRFYWAVGRHPDAVRAKLAETLSASDFKNLPAGGLLNTNVGPGGIALTSNLVKDLTRRFGNGTESREEPINSRHTWNLPRIVLAADLSDTPAGGEIVFRSLTFSKWEGSLNSALQSSGLSPLPGPLGPLVCGTDSVRVKKALGLSEREGTPRLCQAMLPQVGKADVFCLLVWNPDSKLEAIQFSSKPFQGERRR